jgi:hypothetical protein
MPFNRGRYAGIGLAVALMGAVSTGPAGVEASASSVVAGRASAKRTTPPECEQIGREHDCWDYVGWYWTYSNCRSDPRISNFDHSQYDKADCFQFSGGLTVGLYWHRP